MVLLRKKPRVDPAANIQVVHRGRRTFGVEDAPVETWCRVWNNNGPGLEGRDKSVQGRTGSIRWWHKVERRL